MTEHWRRDLPKITPQLWSEWGGNVQLMTRINAGVYDWTQYAVDFAALLQETAGEQMWYSSGHYDLVVARNRELQERVQRLERDLQPVTCARCGTEVPSRWAFVVESGDGDFECPQCWHRCEEKELRNMLASYQQENDELKRATVNR